MNKQLHCGINLIKQLTGNVCYTGLLRGKRSPSNVTVSTNTIHNLKKLMGM
jgi:hypothetical protein